MACLVKLHDSVFVFKICEANITLIEEINIHRIDAIVLDRARLWMRPRMTWRGEWVVATRGKKDGGGRGSGGPG